LIKRLNIIKDIKGGSLLIDQKEKLRPNTLDTKIAEASAWIKKYFKAASEFRGDFELIRIAMRARMLISSPIHAANQEGAEIANKDPEINKNKNIIFQGRINIKRRTMSIFGI